MCVWYTYKDPIDHCFFFSPFDSVFMIGLYVVYACNLILIYACLCVCIWSIGHPKWTDWYHGHCLICVDVVVGVFFLTSRQKFSLIFVLSLINKFIGYLAMVAVIEDSRQPLTFRVFVRFNEFISFKLKFLVIYLLDFWWNLLVIKKKRKKNQSKITSNNGFNIKNHIRSNEMKLIAIALTGGAVGRCEP